MKTVGELGEIRTIRRLTSMLKPHPNLSIGAGDDCAVTHIPGSDQDQVFTTDPIIESVHFLPTDEPTQIGNKAAGRVLSDLAAMGAQPQWLLINVVAPASLEIDFLEKIYQGISTLSQRFGATLIGGDLAEGSVLELHLFGTGTLPAGSALLRSKAQVNDQIFTTGKLGGSRTGKHLNFTPRVEEGLFLRKLGWVHSMIDISDGLGSDLRHILRASNVGAILDANAIPYNHSLESALFDGEDFELLFTLSPKNTKSLLHAWNQKFKTPLYLIGTITNQTEQLKLKEKDGTIHLIKSNGFAHFSSH